MRIPRFVVLLVILATVPLLICSAQNTVFTYQGRITDNGTNFNGTGQFEFALVSTNASSVTTTYWSNDGTSVNGSEPGASVAVNVNNGLFMVVLGDTTKANMEAIAASVFNQPNLQLRIWFNDGVNGFAALNPAQNLTPTPYAVFASTSSNLVSGLSIQSNTNGAPNLIGGSSGNSVAGGVLGATIGGGGATNDPGYTNNSVTGNFGTVSGGVGNIVTAEGATVSGGEGNTANNFGAVVSGGYNNSAGDTYTTVAGGYGNQAAGSFATVGGGAFNKANNSYSTAAGGYLNNAGGFYGTIGGGYRNIVGSNATTVAGGYLNAATNTYATVSGGSGNVANGYASTVAGGNNNLAHGNYSFAAGNGAQAQSDGLFVWSDSQAGMFSPAVGDMAAFRVGNGVLFYAGNEGGGQYVEWYPGLGSWDFSSDRNLKERFEAVDTQSVLEKVARLPILEWNYKKFPQRHIGAMAQDFHALFPLNDDDRSLNELDLHGVELAAIQGLNDKVEVGNQKSEARMQKLEAENAELKQQNGSLEKRLETLEEIIRSINSNQIHP